MKIATVIFTLVLAFSLSVSAQAPPNIIFDTDMGNDIDDSLALAMLHAFQSRQEANLIAVTVTKDNRWAAPYIDLVDTFYGRAEIPIGTVRNGKTPDSSSMIQVPSERRSRRTFMVVKLRSWKRKKEPPMARHSCWGGAGFWTSVDAACNDVVKVAQRVAPQPAVVEQMNANYATYRRMYPAILSVFDRTGSEQ